MARNSMYACLSCRTGNKSGGMCLTCGEPMMDFGPRITIPKKNNHRAWKRIANGEIAWNRRRSRYKQPYGYSPRKRARGRDVHVTWEYEKILVDTYPFNIYRTVRIPGSMREVTNFRRKPDVDLGS